MYYIINIMNNLPNEIQDIIYSHYWQFKYQNVINELKKCIDLENKIKNFLYTYCFRDNIFDNNYLHYLISFNNDIKNIIKNKNFKHVCNVNKLTLFHCFDEQYKNNIFSSINDNLKYIAMFSVCCAGQMRYIILNRFHQLSKIRVSKFSNNELI